MTSNSLVEEVVEERRRNLEDIVRHARWEAEMVKNQGMKWFETRDKWLIEAWEADREMWRDPKIRDALIKAILARDMLRGKEARVQGPLS
ncbi:MAG: hypothetical protein DSY37_04495 [Hyperthermus sp.]|nr:MAG: hypothetical protein DSY37_04495 [Hyperthermus sp.]